MMIARVIVDIKHESINRTFDYLIHEKDQQYIQKGVRVLVPFTDYNILRMGFVYDIVETSELASKYVEEVLDVEPVFSKELFLLLDTLAQNPNVLIAEAFETIIPKQLLMHYEKQVTLLKPDLLPEDLKHFFKGNRWTLLKKDQVYYSRIQTLVQKGIVELKTVLKSRNKKPLLTMVRLHDFNYVGTTKQNEALHILKQNESMLRKDLVEQSSASIVQTLIKKGVIEVFYEEEKLAPLHYLEDKKLPELKENYKTYLEDVLTNGKSQVYVSAYNDARLNSFFMHLIFEVIKKGKQALILVPENFMMEDIKNTLEQTFPSIPIVDLKSSHTDRQMRIHHTAILDNEAKIVIGARSSVFTNFYDLGLIVALDSNNPSYVAHEGILYDTLEIAKIRAKFLGIPLYLTSSALSLDSYQKVKDKQYKQLEFSQQQTKNIEIVDMKEELKSGHTKLVSRYLHQRIDKTLSDHKKVLLILNQKGYAPFVMCRSCSYVPKDPNTDIPLRFDAKQGVLKSNLTRHEENFSNVCPQCGKPTMKAVGSGIDQLIHFIQKQYPNYSVLKVDADTISSKDYYQKIDDLDDIDIIVGTQMALKSNLENKVDLVGILMIDQWLKLPTYNAYEITFDILMQAKYITHNELIIQSYDPNHFVLESVKNDPSRYYKEELSRRKLSKLPPFYKLLQLRIEGPSYLKTFQYAASLKQRLESLNMTVLGPTASVLLKSDAAYRVLLLVKYQQPFDKFSYLLKSDDKIKIYMNHTIEWY